MTHAEFVLRWATDEEAGNKEWDDYWNAQFPPYSDKLQMARNRERAILRGNEPGKLK